jgi:N-acetylglutamate synthase-like GNAT family acetyltransferase
LALKVKLDKKFEKKIVENDKIEIEFIEYNDIYKEDLKNLTLEWLEKYVSVEPEDVKFIENPIEYVLTKGDCIILAKHKNEIIGTVSLYKVSETEYELAKLAVTEKYKGIQLGRQLMQLAINRGTELGASNIILYTTKKLEAAYNLYLKFGFKEIMAENKKYIEEDIKMELQLIHK